MVGNDILDLILTFLKIYILIGVALSALMWVAYTKSEKIKKRFEEDVAKNGLDIDKIPLMILLLIFLWGPILIKKNNR